MSTWEISSPTGRRLMDVGIALAVPVLFLVSWQVAVGAEWIDGRIYPAPTTIIRSGWDIARDGILLDDVWTTTRVALQGYVVGSLAGFLIGTAMGMWPLARKSLEPMLNALYVVPKLALLPILLAIFGFGDGSKVALVAVTVFFFIWIVSMEAIGSVPAGYREAAQSLGVNRRQMFLHVLLPASLPQLFVALRVSMGVAVLVLVAAEFVVGGKGLGFLIFNSRQLFLMSRAFVGITVVAIEGVLLAACVAAIGRRLTPWDVYTRRTVRRSR